MAMKNKIQFNKRLKEFRTEVNFNP